MFSSNTIITGGTITQHNHDHRQIDTGKGGFYRILLEAASPAAFHNSGERRDPPKCHPNTRVAVLEKIIHWVLSVDPDMRNSLIMWLFGPAGSGKSAIAQTIAEWAFEEGILLASYFFSRFDPTRNHPRSIVATIAYQAASYFPRVREQMLTAIEADPFLFTRSLVTQIHTAIVEPLQDLVSSGYFNETRSRRLIIIDGLDECQDRDGQMDIIRAISKALQEHHLPLLFLLASRPEHDITHTFGSGYLRDITSRLPLDEGYQPSSDIKLFLQEKFSEIKENHPFRAQIPPDWPAEETLEKIVAKSSGQFIYAATVVKFVKSSRQQPLHRLDIVLGLRPTHGARDMPFSELDELYHHIFSCVQDLEPVLRVMAFNVLTRCFQLELSKVEHILSLNPGDTRLLFCDLYSLIDFRSSLGSHTPSEHLTFLHASLEDFLLDKSRSKGLYIDPPIRHAEFAQALFPCRGYFTAGFDDLNVCAYHLARAAPTYVLRQKILDLDIPGFLDIISKSKLGRLGMLDIPWLLKAIENSQFHDAQQLSLIHIQSFETCVEKHLEKYYSNKSLMVLVAVVSIPSPDFFMTAHIHNLFQLDKKSRRTDRYCLNIIGAINIRPFADLYLAYLEKLLTKNTRLGIYTTDPATYANGAVHLLHYICYHLALQTPWYANHDRTIRRNNPWKWRRTLAWKNPAYKKMIINSSQRGTFKSVLFKEEGAGSYSLYFLPQLLRKAGRSEKLINLARRYKFGILSYIFPYEVKDARCEMARYLERMDRDDE